MYVLSVVLCTICTVPVCAIHFYSTVDILFLRWKGEVKRAPTPSPLTMATLKSLFVAMFGVEVAVKQDPHWVVFMQDAATEEWVPVFSTE